MKLKDYWPRCLQDLVEFQQIANAEQPEFETALDDVRTAADDFFLATLYEEGLTMGMKLDGLANFGKALVALQADIPEIMDKLVVGEGRFARDQARKICTEENIINTGDYRRNFNSSSKAIRIGTAYKIDVFNNLDYAKPLEYGFRGHFVPGHWDGKSFVYQPKDPQGGMFVHSLIPGHYTLERAVNATKRTQNARLQRRFEQELKKRGYMKYFK